MLKSFKSSKNSHKFVGRARFCGAHSRSVLASKHQRHETRGNIGITDEPGSNIFRHSLTTLSAIWTAMVRLNTSAHGLIIPDSFQVRTNRATDGVVRHKPVSQPHHRLASDVFTVDEVDRGDVVRMPIDTRQYEEQIADETERVGDGESDQKLDR